MATQLLYGVGYAEDLTQLAKDEELKYKCRQAFQVSLRTFQRQVKGVMSNSGSNSTESVTLTSYQALLTSLAFSLLHTNCQVTSGYSKLTRYGEMVNSVRKTVNTATDTSEGLLGTLARYAPKVMVSSDLDYIEKLIVNYYVSLDLDPYSTPISRYLVLLDRFELPINPQFYTKLEAQILEVVTQDSEVSVNLARQLLDSQDFTSLATRMYLLNFDKPSLDFLISLYEEDKLDYDWVAYRARYLAQPFGGLILPLVAYCVEGLISAARYISMLGAGVRVMPLEEFIRVESEACQTIAEYLTLTYDASLRLSVIFETYEALNQTILSEIQTFIQSDILTLGDYRLYGY
jgi:hypothetical protein